MPSLKDLANTVADFRYYSGVGNFTARNLPYGEEEPLFTTAVGFRWSPSNFDGGVVPFGAVTRASRGAADLFRIGKWLSRDPKGPLFVVKQSILQRSNPNIEFPKEVSIGDNNLGVSKNFGPTRVYSPLPLIAQVVGSVVGTKFMRHGFLPQFSDTTAYEKYVYGKDKSSGGNENRLYVLYNKLSNIDSEESKGGYVLSYRGGPGSFLGIGKTVIPRYGDTLLTQPTNEKISNYLDLWSDDYLNLDNKSDFLPLLSKLLSNKNSTQSLLKTVVQYKYPLRNGYGRGVEQINRYGNVLFVSSADLKGFTPIPIQNTVTAEYLYGFTSTDDIKTQFLIDSSKTGSAENTFVLGQNQDYRVYKNLLPGATTLPTGSYQSQNLESRIGVSRARKSFDKSNGVASEKINRGTHDKVNYLSLYSSTGPTPTDTFDVNGNKVEYTPSYNGAGVRDLIKFRIKIINNDKAPNGVYIVFRSYINSIKRTVTPKWNPYNYIGRGESFYAYDGFTETINMSFTVAASSRLEMKPLYQKLNYLISSLAPDYASDGKMRGNIAELTVGNFLLYQPGVITGLDMTIDEDSNWETAIDEDGVDSDMHQLPQLIKCNMSFIPIYNFLPKKGFQSPFIGIDKFPGVKDNQRWLRSSEVINQTLTTTP